MASQSPSKHPSDIISTNADSDSIVGSANIDKLQGGLKIGLYIQILNEGRLKALKAQLDLIAKIRIYSSILLNQAQPPAAAAAREGYLRDLFKFHKYLDDSESIVRSSQDISKMIDHLLTENSFFPKPGQAMWFIDMKFGHGNGEQYSQAKEESPHRNSGCRIEMPKTSKT